MEILEMIAEWRRGCTCSRPGHPEECVSCTLGLIEAIERKEKVLTFSSCVTPKFYLVVDRLREVTTFPPKNLNLGAPNEKVFVDRSDLLSLMNEFFRLNSEICKLRPAILTKEEDHRVA